MEVLSSSVKMGTSRTTKSGYQDHLQVPGKPGYSSPSRTVKGKSPVTMGYHVTSPDATPTSVMDLKKRP
jgi:hypothetical protein